MTRAGSLVGCAPKHKAPQTSCLPLPGGEATLFTFCWDVFEACELSFVLVIWMESGADRLVVALIYCRQESTATLPTSQLAFVQRYSDIQESGRDDTLPSTSLAIACY